MSDNIYKTATGTIEYDPEDKTVNEKAIKSFTVRCPGEVDVRVTVWPELVLPDGLLKKGLVVGVRGTYTANESNGKTFHNMSALSIGVGSEVYEKERTANVQKPAGSAEPAF